MYRKIFIMMISVAMLGTIFAPLCGAETGDYAKARGRKYFV